MTENIKHYDGGKLEMQNGCVKWFNDKKGYGWITLDGDRGDVFVHYSGIKGALGEHKTLKNGDMVSFDITDGSKGSKAINVVVLPGF